MHIDLHDQVPAGLFVRSNADGATVSLWVGDQEMIASLTPARSAAVARALTEPDAILQVVGTVRQFTAPQL